MDWRRCEKFRAKAKEKGLTLSDLEDNSSYYFHLYDGLIITEQDLEVV